jgi:hypothetical protein
MTILAVEVAGRLALLALDSIALSSDTTGPVTNMD